MDNTTKDQLRELVTKGFKQRYGTHPDKQALLRLLSELRRIDVAGYAGYYLMAYMIFKRNKSAQPLKATTKFTTNPSKEVRFGSSSEIWFSSQ